MNNSTIQTYITAKNQKPNGLLGVFAKGFKTQFFKQILALAIVTLVSGGVWGQVAGDFQSRTTGNWSDQGTWQRYNGSTWQNNQGHPGQNTGTGTVTIRNSHTVTLNTNPSNPISNLSIEGGFLTKSNNNTAYALNISGDFSISSGTLTCASNTNSAALTINLGGDFNMSGGTITETSTNAAGVGNFIFNKTGTQTFSKTSGTIANTINFTVNSGSNLDLGTSIIDGSTGAFILSSGATLTTANGNGINSTGASGSIQTTTRTFNSGANYVFNAAGAQSTGTFTTTPTNQQINNLTFSGSGVKTFGNARTINGLFSIEGTATVAGTTPSYGTNATLQYKGSALQTTGIEFPATFSGSGGVIIDNANGVNMVGNHTITNALTLTNGAFSIGANTLTLNGTIPICGTLIGGATSNLTIGGTAANTNIPSVTLRNLILNRTNGATLCGDVVVNNQLTLTSGNLSLSNYNLTLGATATISGTPDGSSMIDTNGTGSLIKQSTTAAGLNMTYPVGTGSLYNPMILTGTSGTVAGTASVSVRAVAGLAPNTSATDLNKHWIVSTQNLSSYTTNASFAYVVPNDVNGSQSEYVIRTSTTPAVTWSAPTNPGASGANPLTTTGTSVLDGTWTAREVTQTWYTLRSGNWNDPTIWTLDPAGSLIINPTSSYPQLAVDNVVIKNGKNVMVNLSGLTCKNLTVEGSLDFASTSGHTFTSIKGNGRILLASNNWPAGDATHFTTAGQGEGTTVFYGNSFSLTTARTFYNMEVMMTGGQTLTLMSDYTLNGNLEVKTGTLRINDNASTVKKSITINKDVTVNLNAAFTVGTGDVVGTAYDSYHDVICLGNFTNEGTVQFTNQAQPTYNALPSNGGVNLLFQGASDNLFTCNNTTNLYRMVVNKGTDQTYVLKLEVSADQNFRLFAANNTNSDAAKALYIQNGTLRLTGTMFIPSLTEGGADFYIPATACLWMDSPGVRVNTTATSNAETTINGITSSGVLTTATGAQSFSIHGKFRITDGLLKTNSHGFVVWTTSNAVIQIDGGNVETPGLRSASGSTGKYSYIQTGGTVKMSGDILSDGLENFSATFSLTSPDNVFIMTGGVLEIQDANTVTAASRDRAFEVYSSAGNYNVTGGTIRINNLDADAGNDFYIYSTAPLGNLEITTQTTNIANVVLESPLTILNNVTIGNYGTLDVTTSPYNVTIGGNLSTGSISSTYNARTNTTTFNGAQNSIITNASALSLSRVVINKSVHPTSGQFYEVTSSGSAQLNIASDLTITLGAFNTGSTSPNVAGNIAMASGQITSTVSGVPSTGKIVLTGGATQSLSGSGLNFGSITLNNGNNGAALLSNIVVKDLAFNAAGTAKVNMGVYNLTVNGTITNSAAARYIYGAGNASDGGLSRYVNANGVYTYPVGIAAKYTPAVMTVSAYNDDGYVTIVPVNTSLATTNPTGGILMPYYWRTNHSGFTSLPNVIYTFTYTEAYNDGYYPGKVLDETPYTRSYINNTGKVVETPKTILFDTPFALERANYTAGAANRFTGNVATFYSNSWYGNWNDGAIWRQGSKTGPTGTVPTAGSIVYIYRDGANEGRIWGNSIPNTPAEVIFQHNYTVYPAPDGENVPRLQFNTAGSFNIGRVSGTGMFSFEATTAITLNGDFGNFGTNADSYYLYYGGAATLTAIPTPIPNLMFEGLAKNINQSITVNSDLIIQGGTTITPYQSIDIKRDLSIGLWSGGTFQFRGSGTPVTISVGRNIDFTKDPANNLGTRTIICETTTNNIAHNLIVKGSILHGSENSSTFDLYNDAINRNRVVLELAGTGVHNYSRSSTAVPDFYQIVMNKGVDQTNSFTFNQHFTIYTGGNNSDTKSVTMQNGTLVFNSTNFSAFNFTSGGANFSIPGTSALELTSGTYTATGTSGIDLGGLLKVSGGTLNMAGGDNPIIFGAGGSSTIDVSAGTLIVGGQIRRATNSEVGVLKYYQSGGNVFVGRTTTGAATRGTFEVMGTGSVLSITGGDLYIERAASAAVPGLYLIPETTNLSSANTIHIGSASVGGQTIGVYSTPSLQNLDVLNNSTARLMTIPLTLNGDLSISSGTFNANSLALNIGGNFINNSTFTHGDNTTTFNGSSAQAISGSTSTTFYDLYKTTTNTLTTSTTTTVANVLAINSGTLADNSNTISVKGDLTILGTHLYGGAGKGILLDNATTSQNITGSGTIGMLTINNTKGVNVPVGNLLTINNKLRLEAGVFNIDKNLLTLQSASIIEAGNPFSASNMIQTNISFTDNGVKKIFPSGASGLFTFPIGSGGKYSPVTFTVAANGNSTGSILVKPASEYHPSIQEDSESPDVEIVDKDNVLQYYWTLISSGVSGFSASATMKYDQADVKVTNGYTEADYIAARLLSDGQGTWNKPFGSVDVTNNLLIFTYTGAGDAEISGDYTAGVNNAIPSKVPKFRTMANGLYSNQSIWSLYNEGSSSWGVAGAGIPVGGPRGSIAIVDHLVNSNDNGVLLYSTTINGPTGKLSMGATYGNRLGIVDGNGTFASSVGDLPAADFTDFFRATGGTLEYNGSSNIDILTDLPVINNLALTGSGSRNFPNINIQLLGSLTIDGPNLNNDTYDKTISIKGNITFDGGTFTAGNLASAKLVMNGSALQTIGGMASFTTSTNDLYHFEINNPVGVTLNKPVDISGDLTLTNGFLTTSGTNVLKMTSAASSASVGSSTAFVNGPLVKQLNAGATFAFPIGNANRFGPLTIENVSASGLWRAQYFNSSANDAGLSTISMQTPVQFVSTNEYWNIEAPSAATAVASVRWDSNSGVNPAESGLRGVQWLTDKWHEVTLASVTGNGTSGTAKTGTTLSFNANSSGNYITFGSITIAAYTWTGTINNDWFNSANWSNTIVPSASSNTTIAISTNNPVISGTSVAQTNGLSILSGSTLTVAPGGKLTVNGNLTIANANSLILENQTGSNGMASFITNGTISGPGSARIKLTLPGERWFYLSSPVNGATFGNFNNGQPGATVYVYRGNQWYNTVADNNSNPMHLLEGALVKYANNPYNLDFTGTLNNGSVSRNYTAGGWYLFGNPYPSFISWQNDAGWSRPNTDGTIWYRTLNDGVMRFITYNRSAPAGARAALYPGGLFGPAAEAELAVIPPMQSVWVKVLAPTTISVNNTTRNHGVATSQLKSSNTGSDADIIRIVANNGSTRDGAVIYFSSLSVEGLDKGDSEKRFNDSQLVPEVYTRIGTTATAINGLTPLDNNSRSIPLSVRNRVNSEVTLSFDLSMFQSAHSVSLEDKITGNWVNLLAEPDYTYTPSVLGEVHNRFVIHISYVPTSVVNPNEDVVDNNNNTITITGIRGKAVVKVDRVLLDADDALIEVYTLEGQKVNEALTGAVETLVNLPRVDALFVVKVTAGNVIKTEKVLGKN